MADTYDVPMGPREWDYTCRFGGGQVKAHLRQLTTEEEDDCYDISDKGKVRLSKPKYVRKGCMSITGLTVSGEEVTDGVSVCATPGLMTLMCELFVAIEKGCNLTEAEVKN